MASRKREFAVIHPSEPYQSPLEAHPEHVAAIGMIAIEMGNLDFMLGGLLGALLHIDMEIARTIYLTPRVALGRIEILENAIKTSVQPNTDMFREVDGIRKRARKLIDKRHTMVHEHWGVDIATGIPSRQRIPHRTEPASTPVPIHELRNMIRDIRRVATDAFDVTGALYKSWPPYASLDKSGLPLQDDLPKKKRLRKDRPPKPSLPPQSSPE